ncbi:hypothetical protein AZE42_06968, partial [Rhizopogon vesiculosus]
MHKQNCIRPKAASPA